MSGANDPTHTPLDADPFERALAALQPLAGTKDRAALLEQIERCRRLYRYKCLGLEGSPPPLLCVVVGGTNVGKTTLANAVLGEPLGRPSPLARATKAVTLACHEAFAEFFLDPARWLPGYGRTRAGDPSAAERPPGDRPILVRPHTLEPWRALAFADTPDIDSVLAQNRRLAEDLLFAADLCVFVTSEEKYNDAVVVAFLEQAARLGKTLFVVLNKQREPEPLADLERHVVPNACRDQPLDAPEPRLFAVPYTREQSALEAASAPLRTACLELARDPDTPRRRALAGARRALRTEGEAVLERLALEATLLDRYRTELKEIAARSAARFERWQSEQPVPELHLALERFADATHVPVLDDLNNAVQRATTPLRNWLRRQLGAETTGDRREQARLERDRRERARLEQLLLEAILEAKALPERYPPEIAPALEAAQLGAHDAQTLCRLDAAFLDALDRQALTWQSALLESLEQRTRSQRDKLNLARALKALTRLGVSGAEIALTGSIGLSDLLLVPALDLASRAVLERTLGQRFFADHVAAFRRERAERFRAFVEAKLETLALERLHGVDRAALERFHEALEAVCRDEPELPSKRPEGSGA